MGQANLVSVVEAIKRGPDSHECQLCGAAYSCQSEYDPSPLCNLCAQAAVEFLPSLLEFARFAMIPERDASDQYDAWHQRLLLRARGVVYRTVEY